MFVYGVVVKRGFVDENIGLNVVLEMFFWDCIKVFDLQNFATCPILPHRKHVCVSGFFAYLLLFRVPFCVLHSFKL